MIPAHKCIRGLCDPDEGIHCIPDFFYPEGKLEDWQRSAKKTPDIEVLKVKRDSDVTPQMQLPVNAWGNPKVSINPKYVGFLIWLREKEPA